MNIDQSFLVLVRRNMILGGWLVPLDRRKHHAAVRRLPATRFCLEVGQVHDQSLINSSGETELAHRQE